MTEQHKGYSIEISQEELADNPLDYYGDDVRICILSRRHANPVDYWRGWRSRNRNYECFPLWVFIAPGGATAHYLPTLPGASNPYYDGRLGHRWEQSARAGFIAVKKSRVRGQVKRFQTARDAVAEYTAYSTTTSYRYIIRDSVGDLIYSCGAYYTLDQARQESRCFIDNL